eukprot:403341414
MRKRLSRVRAVKMEIQKGLQETITDGNYDSLLLDQTGLSQSSNIEEDSKNYEKSKADQRQLFFDYVDPSSGILMNSDNPNIVYYELLGIEHFLKDYPIKQIGMCRIIDHPKYGLDAYPATIFTNAQIDVIEQIIQEILINQNVFQ